MTPALGRLTQEDCREFEFNMSFRMKLSLKKQTNKKYQSTTNNNNNKNLLNLRGKSHKSYVCEFLHVYVPMWNQPD